MRFSLPVADFTSDRQRLLVVLDGARQILTETWAEDAELSGRVREWLWDNARLKSGGVSGKADGDELPVARESRNGQTVWVLNPYVRLPRVRDRVGSNRPANLLTGP